MTDNEIRIMYLLQRYVYRHPHPTENPVYKQIVWYSIPVVYPDFEKDQKLFFAAQNKRECKVRRARKYMFDMAVAYDTLHFLTLEFSDSYIGLKQSTLHQYAFRYLSSACRDYYANEDFGTQKGRLHVHAVVSFKEGHEYWKYGYYHIVKIISPEDVRTGKRIMKYMNKLVFHANKLGTGKSFHKRGLKEVDSLPF